LPTNQSWIRKNCWRGSAVVLCTITTPLCGGVRAQEVCNSPFGRGNGIAPLLTALQVKAWLLKVNQLTDIASKSTNKDPSGIPTAPVLAYAGGERRSNCTAMRGAFERGTTVFFSSSVHKRSGAHD